MVEEVPDDVADGPVRGDHGPRLPIALHRLQLSPCLRLVDRDARRHVLLPIQGLLHPNVQQEGGGGSGGGCRAGEEQSRPERERPLAERSQVE